MGTPRQEARSHSAHSNCNPASLTNTCDPLDHPVWVCPGPSCWSLAGRKANHARQSSLLQKGRWKLRGKYFQALTEVSLDNGDTSLFLSPVPREWSLGLTCCFVSLSGPFVLLPLHPILKMGKLVHHRGNGVRRALGQSKPVGRALGPQSGLRLVDNPYPERGEAEGPGYSGKLGTNGKRR